MLGHHYGITTAAVRKVQMSGALCLLDLDFVADAKQLRESGFDATFMYIEPEDKESFGKKLRREIFDNPPLGYTPHAASERTLEVALAEVEASK